MAALRASYRRLPDPIRREIALRPLRRWLRATLYARWHNARVGRSAGTVNFFPMRPEPRMQVAWMLRALRLQIGFEPVYGEPTIAWDTGTMFRDAARREMPADAINGRCIDVSKSRVDSIWEQVSGYSIRVDPRRNVERMVVKPEANGAHGGRLVTGATKARPGFVYQRYIDTRSDGLLRQVRPVIIGREIPAVLEFWRASPDPFEGTWDVAVRPPGEVYTPAECAQILEFADLIGLELGELDVLRDSASGLIYVIDANRTSFRPSRLTQGGLRRCYRMMVPPFRRLIEARKGVAG